MAAMILRFFLFYIYFQFSTARNHTLTLTDDSRKSFGLSTFGLLSEGSLLVHIKNFSYKRESSTDAEDQDQKKPIMGFSLEKTASDGIASYMDASAPKCVIDKSKNNRKELFQYALVLFEFDLDNEKIIVRRIGKDFSNLSISDGLKVDSNDENNNARETDNQTPQSTNDKPTPSTNDKPTPSTTDKPPPSTTDKPPPSPIGTPKPQAPTPVKVKVIPENSLSRAPNPNKNAPTKTISKLSDHRKRREVNEIKIKTPTVSVSVPDIKIDFKKSNGAYTGQFKVLVKKKEEEGLYNLYFHNCHNYDSNTESSKIDMEVVILEVNANSNYLSAGERPLPTLFGVMGLIFLLTAFYWMHILRRNREKTFKIHYMMLLLIIIKSLDLIFNAMNFHFISKDGKPAEPWPILYYIIHLMKGALLFTTIVLIGTGYFFIKHVLSDRDKKIFLIVIPLQVLANTAQIVMDSTEKGQKQYATWKEIFILVDLLCCGAILFPVVWSIRHLQEASQTDGKAAMNLAKLKLFRHYYIMIVCYIYFTRIIVYLLKITVPFQYEWLDEFFMNLATYIFFVVTGYKFQPASNNPYLRVAEEDEDEELEMDEIITSSGAMDGVTRVNHKRSKDDTHAV